jgi:ABC-2 type transport system permease protein
MSAVRTILLVAGREVRQRLRSKLFIWTTVVLSLLMVGGALIPAIVSVFTSDDDPGEAAQEATTVAAVGELDAARVEALEAQLGPVEVERVDDEAAATSLLEDPDEDVTLAILDGARVLVAADTGPFGGPNQGRARSVAEALALVDLLERVDAAEVAEEILALTPLPVEVVGADDPAEMVAGMLVANIGVVFIFGLLMFYASMIVNGIIEEKGSRVVELLVEAVPVKQLMSGKVLGMGAIAVGQVLAMFVPGLVVLLLTNREVLPPGLGGLIAMAAVWFVLGYALYSLLCAGLGSLVSRPEEAQAVLTPATTLALGGYFVGFAAIQAPDATWAVVAGWLPPSAPFVMLVRQAIGHPTVFEVLGSVALLVLAIFGAAAMAARIYEGGILRVGARVKLREAWSSRST